MAVNNMAMWEKYDMLQSLKVDDIVPFNVNAT
jgi:hypothetical protein